MIFKPKDPDFSEKVRKSFVRQAVMQMLGAELTLVEPGRIDITLPYRKELTQQNGYIHAGIITTIADSACGYAAFSLMPAGTSVLSVEFKQNLLSPATGSHFVAEGRIIRPGRTLTVARGDVFAINLKEKKLIATMLATMICVENRDNQ